jgi:hypothetical protein
VRPTIDFDFLTTDKCALDPSSWAALEDAEIDIRKGDYDDQFKGVVHIRLSDGSDVDVIVGKWKWEQAVIDRSERIELGPLNVPVPDVSDLILLKLAAGGPLDLQDILNLLEIHGISSSPRSKRISRTSGPACAKHGSNFSLHVRLSSSR